MEPLQVGNILITGDRLAEMDEGRVVVSVPRADVRESSSSPVASGFSGPAGEQGPATLQSGAGERGFELHRQR
ncbi:MAG: hypothetical protein DMD78_02355 [Candidatus Rokuibacteriota bacterium]|nr:MAG: hypothetical protein DMD78_02355 [Candidatus Rokubacteria bacterium]